MIKISNKIKRIICICSYVVLLAPYLYTIFHSLPTSDDFCMTLDESISILGCVVATYGKWTNWTGEFILTFFQYLFNPLAYAPVDSYLYGAIMCVFFALFVVSYRYLIKSYQKCVLNIEDGFVTEAINLIFISIVLFACNYHEIFYWFVGNSYLWEYVAMYVAVGSMIRYFCMEKGDKKYYITFILCGVICCNAINMCVAFAVCYITACYWFTVREQKKITVKEIFPLVVYIIMGTITVAAPGNYARKSAMGDSFSIIKAIIKSITCSVRRVFYLFENESVFLLVIILFLTGVFVNNVMKKRMPRQWFIIPALIVSLMGTLLPVAIAYGDTPILNNRISFVIDALFIPYMGIFVLWAGMKVGAEKGFSQIKKNRWLCALVSLCVVYSIFIKDQGYSSCEYVNQIRNLQEVRQERELWAGIYQEIYNSNYDEVTVYVPDECVINSGVLENPKLDEDPKFWINGEIRRYFKKQSISVVMNEKD